jgi:S1-C subfamily serine protease
MKAVLAAGTSSASAAPAGAPSPQNVRHGTVLKTGSGYALDEQGTVVTNNHVIEGCGDIALRQGKIAVHATLLATDEKNDLAAVRGAILGLQAVTFRDGRGVRPADPVIVVGYPYAGLLATTPEVTTGTVTALAGLGDDSRYLQISAPVQPGNSGGPLFDLSGNVVGTVVATLNALAVANATGSLPQNINFAIKAATVREFLDGRSLPYRLAPSTKAMDPADASEAGVKSVVMVECTN